jgi:hypothetical protein
MAKLSNILLSVALMCLLYSMHQAQSTRRLTVLSFLETSRRRSPLTCYLSSTGRRVAYDSIIEDAAMQWRPLLNTTAMAQQAVHPNAITLRYCDRCTCCSPVICQTFNCCLESVCAPEPLTGLPNKSSCTNTTIACGGCSMDTCR